MGKNLKLPPEVQKRISDATSTLAEAEQALERAMREVATADRADKRMISEVLQSAFDKLAAAQAALAELIRPPS